MTGSNSAGELRLDGRTVIVTGGARGIGRAHVLELARRGANVAIVDLGRSVYGDDDEPNPVAETVAEVESAGGRALAISASVATSEGAQFIVDQTIEAFGGIDALVNNAGILEQSVFPDVSDEQFAAQVGVHLAGTFFLCRAAWPALVTSRKGRVINTTSSAALFGMPKQAAYAAAKAGVLGLTKALAAIGDHDGIKVNAIAPGAYTRMSEADLQHDAFREFTALHRDAARIAPVVAVLAHAECPVSGEMLAVSGGRVARVFLAEAPGYTNPDLTAETLLSHWSDVMAEEGYVVPADVSASLSFGLEQLRAAGVAVPSFDLDEFKRS